MGSRKALAVVVAMLWVASGMAAELARVSGTAPTDGARVVEHYPGFVLVEGDAAVWSRLRDRGATVEVLSYGYRLELPNLPPADPARVQPWVRGQSFPAGALYLVQFHGPTKAEWIEALEQAGVELVQYLHPYTYVVWNRSGDLGRATGQLAAVRWVGPHPPEARIGFPSALRSDQTAQVLRVMTYRGAGVARAEFTAVGASVLDRAVIDARVEEFLVAIPGTRAALLAAVPGVLSVQDLPVGGGTRGELSNQQFVGNVGTNDLPLPNYPAWLNQVGVNGTGILMANVDSGLDENHPNLVQRMRPCTGTTCGGTASSHGTHTAGIMAADGSNGVRDGNGFLRGLGVAPAANLIEQRYSPFFTQAGGMLLLMRESAANGAWLSSNSWGPSPSPRGYDADTRQVDVGVRDTDPDTPGDQPLLYVLSIMNGNGGTSTQGTPDEAKNVLTVGSTNSQATNGAPLTTWRSISPNSAHGPALDGRTIPHVVAPGCRVDSTTPNGAHGLSCGTSMASPHVSGGMALFGQAYRQRFGVLPSAALAKAYALVGSVDLFGGTDANGNPLTRRPNARQGWGALRMGLAFERLVDTHFYEQDTVFTATGQEWTRRIVPRRDDRPVVIVLAYTDAPGHGTCASSNCTTPAWNNDLDLLAEVGSSTYRGNVFDPDGFSVTGGSGDERNNMEMVQFRPDQVSGPFILRVAARNINSDALPNSPGALQQDFALACYNCKEITDPFRDGFE